MDVLRTAVSLASTAAVALAAALAVSTPALASAERMQLHCGDGRTIERTNGSSWWDVGTGEVLLTERIVVADGDEVLHQHDYGRKAPRGERSTCTADHFGTTWTVDLTAPR